MDEHTIKQIEEITGDSPDAIKSTMTSWHGQKSKRIARALIDLKVESARTKLEHCKAEELTTLQGVIAGLRMASNAINFGAPKNKEEK
jgi:hypothetical protein